MIKLLKNKEVRKALLWQLLLSAAACAVCFFFDIRAGQGGTVKAENRKPVGAMFTIRFYKGTV